MNDEFDPVNTLLESTEWYEKHARKLIAEYKKCKTEQAKLQLIPKLKHIYDKVCFEMRTIKKLLPDDEGESWKHEE